MIFHLESWLQRVAVLHLEDRCRRALDLARDIDSSVKCLVSDALEISHLSNFLIEISDFPYPHSGKSLFDFMLSCKMTC